MKKIVLTMAAIATVTMANEEKAAAESTAKAESSFWDRIHTKGDMRLRYETIERDDKDNKYRTRYRLRYFLDFDITNNFILETAVSSGKGNPTSGNVTFRDDENWADYFIDVLKIDILDLAYKFDNSWIRAGKSEHHLYRPMKTQLIWDNDIRLYGVNYGYEDDTKAYRLGVNKIMESVNEGTDDIYIYIAQYMQSMKLEDTKLNFGGGFYYYDGVKGNIAPYENGPLGNSYTGGFYEYNYAILEAFSELQFDDLFGKPFKVAATLAYNTAVSSDNFAYDASMQLGDTKNINDWKVGYTYRDIQKDAVFAAHNDSDFIAGGTDASGHIITAKYKMAENLELGGHFQWSTLNASKSATGIEADYHRVQLDAILKF
jgi:hypothetical protein